MSGHDEDRELYEDPGLFWNPAPKPTPPVAKDKVTAALDRASLAGGPAYTRAMINARVPHVWRHVATAILAAALDVEEMVRGVLPVLDNYWCGDHIEYHETDDDGETPQCCIKAREDQARDIVKAIRTMILGRP